jgi:hypothetical protein
VLIEKGVLQGYLQDHLSSKRMLRSQATDVVRVTTIFPSRA